MAALAYQYISFDDVNNFAQFNRGHLLVHVNKVHSIAFTRRLGPVTSDLPRLVGLETFPLRLYLRPSISNIFVAIECGRCNFYLVKIPFSQFLQFIYWFSLDFAIYTLISLFNLFKSCPPIEYKHLMKNIGFVYSHCAQKCGDDKSDLANGYAFTVFVCIFLSDFHYKLNITSNIVLQVAVQHAYWRQAT